MKQFMTCLLMIGGAAATALVSGADTHPAEEIIRQTSDHILTQLRKERNVMQTNPNRVYELVDKIVLPHFDFGKMSSWVLGKYWRQASARQKKSFAKEFRVLLVRTYAKSLADNMDMKVEYFPLKSAPQKGTKDATNVTVRTEIPLEGGFPLPIDYSLYLKNNTWKVYDISIDGISLVNNYRTTFANEIRRDGLQKLIKKLAARNQQAREEP